MDTRYLTPDSITPGRGLVLLRALWPNRTDSGLYLPTEFHQRWSPLGEVISSSGREKLNPGDWAVVEDESYQIERSYYDVFRIHLHDHTTDEVILAPIEQEPNFREVMRNFYANPSEWRYHYISVFDVQEDQWVHFNPPDVRDFGLDWEANPTYRLDYIPTVMLNLWTGKKFELFYLIDERRILATLNP